MKITKALISACVACTAAILLSSCGSKAPAEPGDAAARKIIEEVMIPQLVAKDLEGGEAKAYSVSAGRAVLFVGGKPEADKEAPSRTVDLLRISRPCEITILEYRVGSLKFGPVEKNKQGQWTCTVDCAIEKYTLSRNIPGCAQDKGFPIDWTRLSSSSREKFLEIDGFHDEKFDLCYLYEQLKNAELSSETTLQKKLELTYDADKKEWIVAGNSSAGGSKSGNLSPLDPVLADFSQSKLAEYYEPKDMTLHSERDPEKDVERTVICDKLAADYHDRMDKGQIYDEASGKWVDREEKEQNETLREKYAEYRRNEITFSDLLQTLGACPKATLRDPVIRELKSVLLFVLERHSLPTEKNKKILEDAAPKLKGIPDLREELEKFEETIARFDKVLALYKKQEEEISKKRDRLTEEFSGLLANLEKAGEQAVKLVDMDNEKKKLFLSFRKRNKDGVDKVLAYLSSVNYRKTLPSLDSLTRDFFKTSGISFRPFGQPEFEELQAKFIEREMAKQFPRTLEEDLAALKAKIEADVAYRAPRIGEVVTVSCKTGPYAGRTITGKFHGTNSAGIIINHQQIHWNDLVEGRNHFDSRRDAARQAKAFEAGRLQLQAERNAFRVSVAKGPEIPKLRQTWAWQAGWLIGPGSSYTSLKDLFASWYEVTERQHAFAAEQADIIQRGNDDWERFRGSERNDPCAKYVFASLCLQKLAFLGNDDIMSEACTELQLAAEADFILAQSLLGKLYLTGEGGLEKSPEQALFWLKKAADQGDPEAIGVILSMLEKGAGGGEGRASAAKYRIAAKSLGLKVPGSSEKDEEGDSEGSEDDENIPTDEKTRDLLLKAEGGDADAQYKLGNCYEKGDGVPKNLKEAAKWYRKAAVQGEVNAQCSLGFCYSQGRGVPQDEREAAKWYRKAAEQGEAGAQFILGLRYEKGIGVTQDEREAAKWFRKAAEQGHAKAQLYLGLCYENGEGVSKNLKEAAKWYRRAAEQGNAQAQCCLGVLYLKGEGVPGDDREGVFWMRKAAEQGNAQAQFNLGLCYEEGWGVPRRRREAVKWYRKAAEQGHEKAQEKLRDNGY